MGNFRLTFISIIIVILTMISSAGEANCHLFEVSEWQKVFVNVIEGEQFENSFGDDLREEVGALRTAAQLDIEAMIYGDWLEAEIMMQQMERGLEPSPSMPRPMDTFFRELAEQIVGAESDLSAFILLMEAFSSTIVLGVYNDDFSKFRKEKGRVFVRPFALSRFGSPEERFEMLTIFLKAEFEDQQNARDDLLRVYGHLFRDTLSVSERHLINEYVID